MPSEKIKVGPYAAVFVGSASGQGSDVLTQIFTLSTGPMTIVDEIPETYEDVVDNSVQSGRRKTTFSITFYGTDDVLINLARGLAFSAGDTSAGSTFSQYMLLLAYGDETANCSVLIPKCYTIKRMDLNFEKTRPTELALQFVAINRNRFINLFYIKDLDTLAGILGARSPL